MGALWSGPEFVFSAGVSMATFDDVLARLRKRREDLVRLLAEIDAAIEAVPRIKALAEANLVGEAEAMVGQLFTHAGSHLPDSESKKDAMSPREVADVAHQILVSVGKPLKRGALVKAIEAQGYELPGTDKSKNLGTILWRHISEFVNLDKLGYWPRDIRIDGVYDPSSPPDGVHPRRAPQ